MMGVNGHPAGRFPRGSIIDKRPCRGNCRNCRFRVTGTLSPCPCPLGPRTGGLWQNGSSYSFHFGNRVAKMRAMQCGNEFCVHSLLMAQMGQNTLLCVSVLHRTRGNPRVICFVTNKRLILSGSSPVRSLSTSLIHDMYSPNKESVDFKDDNSNGTSLLPILPTVVRDARYQGDAR